MKIRTLTTAVAAVAVALLATLPTPARAWVAAGGYHGAVAVAYAPAVGTVVAALPPAGCSSISMNGISYMDCAGVFYMPFYSGGALMYQVTVP